MRLGNTRRGAPVAPASAVGAYVPPADATELTTEDGAPSGARGGEEPAHAARAARAALVFTGYTGPAAEVSTHGGRGGDYGASAFVAGTDGASRGDSGDSGRLLSELGGALAQRRRVAVPRQYARAGGAASGHGDREGDGGSDGDGDSEGDGYVVEVPVPDERLLQPAVVAERGPAVNSSASSEAALVRELRGVLASRQ